MKSQWFREIFEEDKFEYATWYPNEIHFPVNLSSLREKIPGLNFVLRLSVDVMLYDGYEYVYINPLGWTNDTEWSDYQNDYVTSYVYETDWLAGTQSVIRKYDTSTFTEGEYATINLQRQIEKTSVDKSLEKRNTGFELEWYFEDGAGNRVDIEQENKYEGEKTGRCCTYSAPARANKMLFEW